MASERWSMLRECCPTRLGCRPVRPAGEEGAADVQPFVNALIKVPCGCSAQVTALDLLPAISPHARCWHCSHGGEMRSRGAALAEEARQMAAVPTGDSSLVASIAHAFGVPTETLCTVLLLCAVLFVWRRGAMILHMLGVLLLSAALTLYAFIRRVRRQLSTLTLLALGAVAVACATYMMRDSAQGDAVSVLSSRLLRPPMKAFAASMSK